MPSIVQIQDIINTSLKTGQFKSNRFSSTKWNTEARDIPTVDPNGTVTHRPLIVNIHNGQESDLDINDLHAMQVYHKIDKLKYVDVPLDDFGTPKTVIQEEASCRMIMYGDEQKLGILREQIAAAAELNFPAELKPSQFTPLQLTACVFDMVEVSMDYEKIYQQEWAGTKTAIIPTRFLIAISYVIKSEYAQSCWNLC